MENVINIVGTGHFLPGLPIQNSELEAIFGSPEHVISRQLGVQTRHWATDLHTGKLLMKNSDMAAEAARNALKNTGIHIDEVNLLVLSTFTPDYPIPATLTFIQEKLGIEDCSHIELRAGCAGAVQALRIASDYLSCHPHHTAIVIGSDLMSPFLTQGLIGETGVKQIQMQDRVNALMYGDGAGAAVLKANADRGIELHESHYGCVGNGKEPGFIQLAGGSAVPVNEEIIKDGLFRFKHNYKTVSKEGISLILLAFEKILESQINIDAVDKIYIHAPYATLQRALDELFRMDLYTIQEFVQKQINSKFLMQQIKRLHDKNNGRRWDEIREKIFLNTHIVGNTGSAGPLIALDEINKKAPLRENSYFILVVIEATKWIYSGMLFKQKVT